MIGENIINGAYRVTTAINTFPRFFAFAPLAFHGYSCPPEKAKCGKNSSFTPARTRVRMSGSQRCAESHREDRKGAVLLTLSCHAEMTR